MTEKSYETLRQRAFAQTGLSEAEYLIEVSREDAENFGCNIVLVDPNNVVTSMISDDLKARIENKGYNVHRVDLSQFHLAGGGAHCMVNRINYLHPDSQPA